MAILGLPMTGAVALVDIAGVAAVVAGGVCVEGVVDFADLGEDERRLNTLSITLDI